MDSFWRELKRRKVVKVAVVYAVVAWLLIQIASTVEAPLGLPVWFDTMVIVLLAIGFPVALVMSWAFDLTPGGIVRDHGHVPSEQPSQRSRRTEYTLIAVLIAAVAYFVADDYLIDDSERLPNSVGVLPFDNLSPDPANAFYADGIYETILTELAKIGDLNVIARTTMEHYRDSDLSLDEIADQLNVETIMEGSFQFANGTVRITAQLIDPVTGSHLWTENYDRPFDDIFAIQTDIATSIADALEAKLLPDERRRIEALPTQSPEAYELYLRASAVSNGPSVEPRLRDSAQALLDRALALDPTFAAAYAEKARLYGASLSFDPIPADGEEEYLSNLARTINDNAVRAIELDPDLSVPYYVLGDLFAKELRRDAAREALDRAVALAPKDPQALFERAWHDLYVEDVGAALPRAERGLQLSPTDSQLMSRLATVLLFAGDFGRGLQLAREAAALSPDDGNNYLTIAALELRLGDSSGALEALSRAEPVIPETQYQLSHLAFLYALAGDETAARRVVDRLRAHSRRFHVDDLGWVLADLAVGDRAEALRRLAAEAESDFVDGSSTHRALVHSNVWNTAVLNEPEFVTLRARLGIER